MIVFELCKFVAFFLWFWGLFFCFGAFFAVVAGKNVVAAVGVVLWARGCGAGAAVAGWRGVEVHVFDVVAFMRHS